MQTSCTLNMKVSTQILRPINFVHLANQTGGILHSPPTPAQGGSSSSTLEAFCFPTNQKESVFLANNIFWRNEETHWAGP